MNELFFILQLIFIISSLFGALRMGKEALFAWVVLQELLANLFVIKQIELFGFHVTGSDAFAVGSIFTLNLLQEFYGIESAQKAIRTSFFAMVFFTLLAQVHLNFHPSVYDFSQNSYQTILGPTPRILISSIGVFFIVQQIDVRLFQYFKTLFKGKKLVLRTAICLVISQFSDTLLFSFCALYGIVESITDLIVVSFAIKCITISLFTPFASLCRIVKPQVESHDSL